MSVANYMIHAILFVYGRLTRFMFYFMVNVTCWLL